MNYENLAKTTVAELEKRVDTISQADMRKQARARKSSSKLKFNVQTETEYGENIITLYLNLEHEAGFISHDAEILRIENYPIEAEKELTRSFESIGLKAIT